MNKLINKLPKEVIDVIISYTYKPQSIQLRNDIVSFVSTKNVIINIFKNRYVNFTFVEIKKNLSFHIFNYLIGVKNTYSHCEYKIYEISKRNYILNKKNTKKNIDNYFSNKNPHSIFCIYWGLLTPEERCQFIGIQNKMDTERQP